MFSENKLNISESRNSLSIDFRWFKPLAIFYLFFTLFWCGFLVVWYSISLLGGAPLMALLFPLIHVGVGLYLAYYTLCLFLNRTYIDLDNDWLTVTHQPIPWWRGNTEFKTEDIRQLYVKEKISHSNNRQKIKYHLRAKLTNGKDVPVVTVDNAESYQMLEIERRMEQFLGIPDKEVRGEYGKTGKVRVPHDETPPRRTQRQRINSPLGFWYDSKKGDLIRYKHDDLDLLSVTQYDWKDGNSDKQLQLVNEYDSETLLYFIQNKALLQAYEELPLSLGQTRRFNFSAKNPPTTLDLNGKPFLLEYERKGQVYLPGIYPSIQVKMWVYYSKNKQEYIRIVNKEGQMSFHRGLQVSLEDFGGGLDLNNPPEKEKLRGDYPDEEDFV